MSRTKVIAGNWKMNKTPAEAAEFIMELKESVKGIKNEIIAAVPFVCIPATLTASEGSNIKIAAQNMHWEDKGAYTGEVSGAMLKDLGVEYVIIGHSERREYFGETNETVNRKAHAAFKYGLKPIICVGESLLQRDEGVTAEHVRYQVKVALKDLSAEQVETLILAYEPIWAIGNAGITQIRFMGWRTAPLSRPEPAPLSLVGFEYTPATGCLSSKIRQKNGFIRITAAA